MKILSHKRLHHTFEILDSLEAGLKLTGGEVKSLRNNRGSLEGNKVIIRGGEAFVVGFYIPNYQENNLHSPRDPYETRKLLLSKAQIQKLSDMEVAKSGSGILQEIYVTRNLIKAKLAICKKKNTIDKRRDIKEKDMSIRSKRAGSTNYRDYE